MPHPYGSLTREYRRIARRRRSSWVTHPRLAAITASVRETTYERCEAIVDTVRSYETDQDRSDEAIRALAHIGASEPEATTVLLYALAPVLDFRLWRSVTTDYRNDALCDLAIVIREATDAGDIDDLPDLARRLTRRAHQRSHRRARPRHQEDHWDPHWIVQQHDTTGRPSYSYAITDDVAETTALRIDLYAFVSSLKNELKEPAWAAYREHRLLKAITPNGGTSSGTVRATASRVARRTRPHVARYLVVHA